MDKLYPIVRRVRWPLLPPDEGSGVAANALRASEPAKTPEQKQSGETPITTAETVVVPESGE